MESIFLSVVIPSFDEMANLQKGVLDHVKRFLDKKKNSYEVLIVDDGSTDGSIPFLEKFVKENDHFFLIKNTHMGKAGAVTSGMLKAKGDFVLFTDMDQATPIEETEKLLPYFQEGYDVVIGSRSSSRKGAPFIRLFVSRSAILLRKMIVGLSEISDTQCGFKMFRGNTARDLFLTIHKLNNGFKKIQGSNVTSGFDVELLYIAQAKKYKIKEVPVDWLYVESRRVSPIKDSIQGVKDLLTIKRNALSGKYNL